MDKYQDSKYREDRFVAAVHGIDLDSETGNETPNVAPTKKKQSNFIFGDPTEYEKLSEEERVTRTKAMMGKHQEWAGNLNINI